MLSLYVKLNHMTRILDYNDKFAKIFKYSKDNGLATYHYFRDCMKQTDLRNMMKMKDGDRMENVLYFKNSRMVRGKAFNVIIECRQNGLKRRILDYIPKYEYIIELEPLNLKAHDMANINNA